MYIIYKNLHYIHLKNWVAVTQYKLNQINTLWNKYSTSAIYTKETGYQSFWNGLMHNQFYAVTQPRQVMMYLSPSLYSLHCFHFKVRHSDTSCYLVNGIFSIWSLSLKPFNVNSWTASNKNYISIFKHINVNLWLEMPLRMRQWLYSYKV